MPVSAGETIVCGRLVLSQEEETGIVAGAFKCPLRHIQYNANSECDVCAELAEDDMEDEDEEEDMQDKKEEGEGEREEGEEEREEDAGLGQGQVPVPVSVPPLPPRLTAQAERLEMQAEMMLPPRPMTTTARTSPEAPAQPLQPAQLSSIVQDQSLWNTVRYDQVAVAKAGRNAAIASNRVTTRAGNGLSLVEPLGTIVGAEHGSTSEGEGNKHESISEEVDNRKDSRVDEAKRWARSSAASSMDVGEDELQRKREAAETLKRLDQHIDHFGSSEGLLEAYAEVDE